MKEYKLYKIKTKQKDEKDSYNPQLL